MGEKNSRPILVTGAHRSGTTWVGKMLAVDPEIGYISEPLNVWHRPGVMRVPTQYWYTYICEDNQLEYKAAFQETLAFHYHGWLEIKSLRTVKDSIRMGRDWRTFWQGKRNNQAPLIKDPFAIFSTEWFANSLGCKVVIVVRHPAAVASSLARLGWSFDFSDLLNQPLLMRDFLEPFKTEMKSLLVSKQDVIAQSSLLWCMLYKMVGSLREKHPDFIVIRHEDISIDPLGQFEQLYKTLGLDYSSQVQRIIQSSSSVRNPKEVSQRKVHSVQVDSQANVKNWQQRLSESEIEWVRYLTRDVAPLYYSDEDWQ
jgi:hypothetical protein